MRASELIERLQQIMSETGTDPEVGAQSHGCCHHAHEIISVEMGGTSYHGVTTDDEIGEIVIRV